MGIVFTNIQIINPKRDDIAPVNVKVLADTGSVYLIIPEELRIRLQLEVISEINVTLADGGVKTVPYVGPVEIKFSNRTGFGGAIVMGDQAVLGAIAMEDMDLVISPKTRKIEVNPQYPERAHGLAL